MSVQVFICLDVKEPSVLEQRVIVRPRGYAQIYRCLVVGWTCKAPLICERPVLIQENCSNSTCTCSSNCLHCGNLTFCQARFLSGYESDRQSDKPGIGAAADCHFRTIILLHWLGMLVTQLSTYTVIHVSTCNRRVSSSSHVVIYALLVENRFRLLRCCQRPHLLCASYHFTCFLEYAQLVAISVLITQDSRS